MATTPRLGSRSSTHLFPPGLPRRSSQISQRSNRRGQGSDGRFTRRDVEGSEGLSRSRDGEEEAEMGVGEDERREKESETVDESE